MKYAGYICITVVLLLVVNFGMNPLYGSVSQSIQNSYTCQYQDLSYAGFFHTKSDRDSLSEFRDISTGRLIDILEHKEDETCPMIRGKYIYTAKSTDATTFNKMCMRDRNGNNFEYEISDGQHLFVFDDEIIQVHSEENTTHTKLFREMDDEKIWELSVTNDEDIRWIKGYYTTECLREYIWIIDNKNYRTQAVDPRNGSVVSEFNDTICERIFTNGILAVIKSSDLNGNTTASVIDIAEAKELYYDTCPEYISPYFYDDTVTIISADIPRKLPADVEFTITCVNDSSGTDSKPYTVPILMNVHNIPILTARDNLVCYTQNGHDFKLLDASVNRTLWRCNTVAGVRDAIFYQDYLLISAFDSLQLLDLSKLEPVWYFEIYSDPFVVTEFDGLEYIGMDDAIKVRDTKFDTIEPYEYDISFLGRYGHAEFIPTKHGLLAVPDVSSNNSFNEIRLMRPGVDEPVYSVYMSTGYMSEWERMDDANFIKLTWSYGSAYEDTVWYLHIPTGNCSLELPDEQ